MYWLLDGADQEKLRQKIIGLQTDVAHTQVRDQAEQLFPFVGRKSRSIARTLIEHLSEDGSLVIDPFGGSGTFAYAALDCNRCVKFNEWEPYAFSMSTAPLRGVPGETEYQDSLKQLDQEVAPIMSSIYKTRCPICGEELSFDGLFFDG